MSEIVDKDILEARKELWRRGVLTWKLDSVQKEIYDFVHNNEKKTTVLVLPRRVGKSYFLTIMAVQEAIKKKSIIKFLQPEQKMIRMNIRPIMDKIFEDCPAELKPKFNRQDSVYTFPNGSEIQLAGTDGGSHEKLRGGDSDLCIIDEAGFVDKELQYIVKSVLLPTTLLTGGKIILSSTPPKSADHEFEKYRQAAVIDNSLYKIDIYDAIKMMEQEENPRITMDILNEIIVEYGGVSSDDFRREMLCETIIDGDNAVVPEFTSEIKEEVVCQWRRPLFVDKYVSMDIGFRDYTAILFGFYDFDNAVLIIEDEILLNGPQMTLRYLAEKIKEKEQSLWVNPVTAEVEPPYMRISDNNLIVINDLQRNYGLNFIPTMKDNKEAALNDMRMMIQSHQLVINPRCKNLISHLENATWDKNKKNFTRSADNGHFDTVDALVYMVRNIHKTRNPYPPGYRHDEMSRGGKQVFISPNYQDPNNEVADRFRDVFKVPKSSLKINKSK